MTTESRAGDMLTMTGMVAARTDAWPIENVIDYNNQSIDQTCDVDVVSNESLSKNV